MDLDFPDADGIDSTCHRKLPDPETPDPILPRCGDEAVTWFDREDGTRFYVCPAHAREVLRFGEGAGDLPDDYNELKSYAADHGVHLQNPSEPELRRRLLVAPDAAALPAHPRVSPCRTCHKLTLEQDLDPVERRCRACREGAPEIDVENAVLSSEA